MEKIQLDFSVMLYSCGYVTFFRNVKHSHYIEKIVTAQSEGLSEMISTST